MNAVNEQKIQFWRILAAILYDWILCIAILMLFSGLIVSINHGAPASGTQTLFLRALLFVIICFYFTWFWRQGGQTPGMKVWRLRLVSLKNPNTQGQLFIRFFVVLLTCGLSVFSGVFRRDRRSWHDLLSKTYLQYIPKMKEVKQ